MGIFSNVIEKKTINNYINDQSGLIQNNVFSCDKSLSVINTLISNVKKQPERTENGINFFLNKLAEHLENFTVHLSEAKETLTKLEEYQQSKNSFVGRAQKKNLAIINNNIRFIEHKFLTIYSHSLVAVQIEDEAKQKFKSEFIKTIKTLKLPIHTDEKLDNVGSSTADEV